MPELPEVEVVRRGLAAHVLGRTVDAAQALHPRAVRRQPGGAEEFRDLMGGRTLTATGRRGKFLWVCTDDPEVVLLGHLGMSGQFRVDDPVPGSPGEAHRHARARLVLGARTVWFLDQRTFGWLAAVPMVADPRGVAVPRLVEAIAPDPTEPGFDPTEVARRMRGHRVEVKRLLLDQSLVSGIGNIYADEALWRAGVHPSRHADRMGMAALASVLVAASDVMSEALAEGGTSFDSLYVNVNGESGYFGRGLAAYGRTGLPCPRCGTPIVRTRFMNRSSHFCPRCQRPPRAPH
jgi:formamidopyrimidine-DNA glycosylase